MAYPSASMTGSISRKRVGSVSQRGNETPLTPLDIQSIQMPSNPQNALALKTASLSSTKSLFQTCSTLRKRLRCVEDFHPFLDQPPGAEPLDVVSHMCHTFRLGSPLCHLYNLLIPTFSNPDSPLYAPLPPPKQIEYDFPSFSGSPDGVKNWAKRPEHAKMCQKYIAMFCMAMKQRREEGRWHGEIWALHELWGKSTGDEAEGYDSTGLMKVLHTIESMLDNLPESAISPISPQTPFTANSHRQYGSMSVSANGHRRESYDIPFSMGGLGSGGAAVTNLAATMNGGVRISDDSPPLEGMPKPTTDDNAYKSVEELVSSEKSYVQELEILVRYSQELLEKQIISAESCHQMFANLSKILEFHRKFLIKLETEYEPIEEGNGTKAWAEGSWGRPFLTSEPEFECYGPYCANYLDAITLVNEQMSNLLRGQDLPQDQQPCLHPERELQAFMIKPIQRITKYGLLLDAILHTTAKHEYPYRPELEEGASAVKRIAARINEITDFKAKQATVRELSDRVEDWKGHEIHRFGDLWLDDHFTVTKADQPRDYHVFLFEKMMLCCKEVVPDRKDKKTKSTTILRKDKSMSKSGMPEKRRLALKGRIFVSNINRATLNPADPTDATTASRLTISWTVPQRLANGYVEEVADSFVMIGRSEDQMKKWADKVMELATIERRKHEEAKALRLGRYSTSSSDRGHGHGGFQQSSFAPPTPATEAPPFSFPPPMPNGYHAHANGRDDDDDDMANGMRSGRTTPSIGAGAHYVSTNPNTGRRVQSQQPIAPVDRAELRARAMTEDQNGPSMVQWRSQQPPPMPRLTSNASSSSEASFIGGPSRGLRMTSSRLDMAEMMEEEEEDETPPSRFASARGMTRAPSQTVAPTVPYPPPPPLRNRSASTPNVLQPQPPTSKQQPPLPAMSSSWVGEQQHQQPNYVPDRSGSGSSTTLVGGTAYFSKRMSASNRSSGGSHSTETSETTSSQQSPATPYGVMGGELRGPTPVSRQNSGDGTVLLRVKSGENAFIVSVAPDVNFATLYQKVLKKIRLGRPVGVSETIHLKWIDADEDEISLRCDGDIEAMFGEARESGMGHVNLVAK